MAKSVTDVTKHEPARVARNHCSHMYHDEMGAPRYFGPLDVYEYQGGFTLVFPEPIKVPRIWDTKEMRDWVHVNGHDPLVPAVLRGQTHMPYDAIAAFAALRGIMLVEKTDE